MELIYIVLGMILTPIILGLGSHLMVRIPKYGQNLARWNCVIVAYLELIPLSYLLIITSHAPIYLPFIALSTVLGILPIGFYIDYLALIPALLSSLFTALTLTYNLCYTTPQNRAYELKRSFNRSFSFILIFNGMMLGTLFSDNLLMVIFFWEMISLCSYILISTRNQDDNAIFAAKKCIIFTHFGGFLLFLVAVILFTLTGTLSLKDYRMLGSIDFFVIVLILIACLPKTVLFPFHTWLPDGTVAPSSATVLFHVCGFQSGIYLILRFFADIFYKSIINSPKMPLEGIFGDISIFGFVLALIGAITLVIGGLNGLYEFDFKRIIAYSTMSQLGYIIMVAGFLTPLSLMACIFHMMSHALFCSLLFLCAGAVLYATGIHDIREFGYLHKNMPKTTKCCLIGILSLSSMPLLADFASKYFIFHAIIDIDSLFFLFIAICGCILNTLIAIRMFYMVFLQNQPDGENSRTIEDPPRIMVWPMFFVIVLIIFFGVLPLAPIEFLIIKALEQINLTPVLFREAELINTYYGFWNPTFILEMGLVIAVFLFVFQKITSKNPKTKKYSESSTQLYLGGQLPASIHLNQRNYLNYILIDVLKIPRICHMLNIDRLFYSIARIFNRYSEKLLEIQVHEKLRSQLFLFLVVILSLFLIVII